MIIIDIETYNVCLNTLNSEIFREYSENKFSGMYPLMVEARRRLLDAVTAADGFNTDELWLLKKQA